MIKKVPVPLCGVMLGTAALGNLLQGLFNNVLAPEAGIGDPIRNICGVFAAFLLVLILLKLIMFPGMIKEDMQNPIMAGVSATFPMGVMILSTYIKPFAGGLAQIIWFIGIALHVALIIYFTMKFVAKFELGKVFTTWFIVYVGIAVAGVTAPVYEKTGLGAITFWFGLVTLIPLLFVVYKRYASDLPMPAPAKPLIGIYAAPMSLCVAAYVQSVMPKNFTFLLIMWAVATALYVFGLVKSLPLVKNFFPSFAAFTFPFVISAIASLQTMACAKNMEHPLPWLKPIVLIEALIAVVFVVFVYAKFMKFIFAGPKPENK